MESRTSLLRVKSFKHQSNRMLLHKFYQKSMLRDAGDRGDFYQLSQASDNFRPTSQWFKQVTSGHAHVQRCQTSWGKKVQRPNLVKFQLGGMTKLVHFSLSVRFINTIYLHIELQFGIVCSERTSLVESPNQKLDPCSKTSPSLKKLLLLMLIE